jgi:NADH-quinone oxidoreductase subunit N
MDLANAYDTLLADLGATFSLTTTALMALVLVVVDAYRNNDRSIPWIAALTLGACMVGELFLLREPTGTAWYGMVRTGGYAAFVNLVVLGCGLLTVVLSVPYLNHLRRSHGEVYALLLFATVGMIVLGTANNLVAIFVGLETMSICLYILTGLVREDEGSIESALKYFLLGAFSTGFFLYGIALLYGATGTMMLPEMGREAAQVADRLLYNAGLALLLIGFLFKVSAAPFHMWTPDVYQGAPTTLTGYMATASKAAAFASFILVLQAALPAASTQSMLSVVAVITMILGNVVALMQQNVKRMLAYSSIAHAGYVLTGLAAGTPEGYAGALYYTLIYAVMNIGAFGVMALLEWDDREGRHQTLDSLSGIGYRKPLLGVLMGFFMFSLSGFPPLAGFLGKYAVFAPAVQAGLIPLVVVGVLASAASAYYYLRVLYVFWMKSPDEQHLAAQQAAFPVPIASQVVLIVCAVLLLALGVLPGLMDVTAAYFDGTAVAARP